MSKKCFDTLECNSAQADETFYEAIKAYSQGGYKSAAKKLSLAHKLFLAHKNIAKVSMCLSLTALVKYITKEESYYKSILLAEDSKFLAESTGDKTAEAVNKFVFAQIYFYENKFNDVLLYLDKNTENLAEIPFLLVKSYELLAMTYNKRQNPKYAFYYLEKALDNAKKYDFTQEYTKLKNLSVNFVNAAQDKKNDILLTDSENTTLIFALSNIARAVGAEANLDKLLITIAEQTRLVLNADRCSVFLYDKEKDELWSKIALGLDSEEIRFPADCGFAGHVFKTGETIRIKDAYKDSRFNKEIDKHTGYKTYNMLCMPIRNIKLEIIGVFQVLNKKSGEFSEYDEDILLAIGTNAGIAIENNMLFKIQQKMLDEQQKLFAGFIDTLAASIDARDKITLGHSTRVKLYSELICGKLNLNKDVTGIISKAAMLHDIGKIGIKDAVLQKKGALTKEEYEQIKEHVKITYDILCKTNLNASFAEIAEIAASHHEKYDGTGYFRGLKGEEIPFGGRILAVGDVFDAITSVRHYRDRMPMKDALKIMYDGRNKHFDGNIIDTFFKLSCSSITDVLISDYEAELKPQDREILNSLTVKQLYDMLQKEDLTPKEQDIINMFNSYYMRNKTEAVNV